MDERDARQEVTDELLRGLINRLEGNSQEMLELREALGRLNSKLTDIETLLRNK